MVKLSDIILAEKIRQGNKEAFKEIYDRYHRQLFFLAKKYVKKQQLAEDAVQDVFLKLWKKRSTLDSSKSVKAFLFTMMKNHLLNMIRDQKKEILSDYTPLKNGEAAHHNQTEDDVIYAEYQNILKCGLAELSKGNREVFEMKVFKGLTNSEVADQRSVSIHTVKSQFYSSSAFIKSYLKKHANIKF